MTSRRTLRRISSKVEAERSNGSKSLFALGPRACWQKNASRREVRGVHNRSGVYPDPSNWRDRLLCFVPTTVLVSEWQLHSSRFTNTPGPLPAVLLLFAECRFLSRRRIRDTADIFTWNSAPSPPPLNSRRNKETYSAYTKLLRDRRFIRVFLSSPLRNSSIIAAKTTNFRLSSTRDFFKFFKKIRIPWLKISIELRLFNILSGVIRFNMYIRRSLLLVKRNEVEYHHLPGSRQADSSRRLLALIVSRHAARARYPSSSSQPLPLCCCRLTFLRHAASPRGSAPPHWQMGQQTSDYA